MYFCSTLDNQPNHIYYCDQPFVSETTRCESVDFIQTIDDQDKMFCAFMWIG